jgi:hypothetical protein
LWSAQVVDVEQVPGAKRHRGVDRVSPAKPHAISHDVLAAGALLG